MEATVAETFFERVYGLVRQIPPGKVATYGQIAWLLGKPHGARAVGWALRAVPSGSDVPWHRVLNAEGRISIRARNLQRSLLEAEGVPFDETGRVDLDSVGWQGPADEGAGAALAVGDAGW
jgi:methylated-DNA-protein-cysteine methyltransferase-like protein